MVTSASDRVVILVMGSLRNYSDAIGSCLMLTTNAQIAGALHRTAEKPTRSNLPTVVKRTSIREFNYMRSRQGLLFQSRLNGKDSTLDVINDEESDFTRCNPSKVKRHPLLRRFHAPAIRFLNGAQQIAVSQREGTGLLSRLLMVHS
jgi:hypothetical protein